MDAAVVLLLDCRIEETKITVVAFVVGNKTHGVTDVLVARAVVGKIARLIYQTVLYTQIDVFIKTVAKICFYKVVSLVELRIIQSSKRTIVGNLIIFNVFLLKDVSVKLV